MVPDDVKTLVVPVLAHRVVGKSFLQAGEFGAAEADHPRHGRPHPGPDLIGTGMGRRRGADQRGEGGEKAT